MKRSSRFSLVSLLAVLLILGGCSSSGRRTLVVYSPHGKEMLSAFEKAFESAYPDVDVQWVDMGSQDAYDRIRTERTNPQADIWWGAPWLMFDRAEHEGLLERYIPTWDQSISPQFKSAGGFWYGTFLTPEVIVYNDRVVPEADAPRDWDDLLDPRWKNKIIIRYPLASGTMRIIYAALIQKETERTGNVDSGFAWLLRLDANTKSYAADPTQLYLKIAREEGVVTLWDLPDVIIQKQINNYPFGYRIPESGTPLITEGIAIVKGTKKGDDAKRFYEFVTTKESMIRQANEFYRIPARSDIPPANLPVWLVNLNIKPLEIDWKAMALHEQEWMKRWDQTVRGNGKGGS